MVLFNSGTSENCKMKCNWKVGIELKNREKLKSK